MKRYSFISFILFFIFVFGVLFSFIQNSQSQDIKKEIEALKVVFPEARLFSKKTGTPPHYKAYTIDVRTEEKILLGLAFLTTDVSPEIYGYAGPIKVMVGMDLNGSIMGVYVISHSETPSYVLTLDAFLNQFFSKGINSSYVLGKDIDGISRATITSNAIVRAVEVSLKDVATDVLKLKVPTASLEKIKLPLDEIIIPIILFGVAVAGIFTFNSTIRWLALLGGLLYFGFMKSTMISTVHIANVFLLKFPSFSQSPLWYMLMGLTLVTTYLWGMVYCGSLCPFASVQELLYNLVNRKKGKKLNLSRDIDYRTRTLKHSILVIVIMISLVLGNSSAASIEPFLTLFTQNASMLGWAVLIFMLAASMLYFRFWCKYLCPVGAFLGLVADKSLFKIKLTEDCIHCDVCERICPTRALTMDDQKLPLLDYSECILCGKCVQKCPKNSLKIKK